MMRKRTNKNQKTAPRDEQGAVFYEGDACLSVIGSHSRIGGDDRKGAGGRMRLVRLFLLFDEPHGFSHALGEGLTEEPLHGFAADEPDAA